MVRGAVLPLVRRGHGEKICCTVNVVDALPYVLDGLAVIMSMDLVCIQARLCFGPYGEVGSTINVLSARNASSGHE